MTGLAGWASLKKWENAAGNMKPTSNLPSDTEKKNGPGSERLITARHPGSNSFFTIQSNFIFFSSNFISS
jgi:hypothetical protein